jgi:hypothetical protein
LVILVENVKNDKKTFRSKIFRLGSVSKVNLGK